MLLVIMLACKMSENLLANDAVNLFPDKCGINTIIQRIYVNCLI